MCSLSSKSHPDRPRKTALTEMQRANLRALLRHIFRVRGTWIRVAHAVKHRRAYILAFLDGLEPGTMALARAIAKAVGLSLDDALVGKAPSQKAPDLVVVPSIITEPLPTHMAKGKPSKRARGKRGAR